MNRIWLYFRGYWTLELCGASPDWALNGLISARIPFWNVLWIDAFTVRINVFSRDQNMAERIAEKAMCTAKISQEQGFRELIHGVWHRPVLYVALMMGCFLVLVLPKFVLFYDVEGNESVSDARILRELDEMNIGFGVYGPTIKSQWVEDHMLNEIDELQWITVNQTGCKAQVIVRERPETPVVQDRKGFSNIVASHSGIITDQIVWTGQPIKGVGDVVEKGEMLVSGVVDLERTFLLTRAQAEIYAKTRREYCVTTPSDYWTKGENQRSDIAIWLEIGKRRIKIFGNSGISTASCDKMISRKRLSLPGAHILPISLVYETCIQRNWTTAVTSEIRVQELLSRRTEQIALHQMIAGTVIRSQETLVLEDGRYCLMAKMDCREMIAETVKMNWIEEDWKYD